MCPAIMAGMPVSMLKQVRDRMPHQAGDGQAFLLYARDGGLVHKGDQ